AVADLKAMNACDRQAERGKEAVEFGSRPAGYDGESAIERVVKQVECVADFRAKDHPVRAIGDVDERAVEIEEQGGTVRVEFVLFRHLSRTRSSTRRRSRPGSGPTGLCWCVYVLAPSRPR